MQPLYNDVSVAINAGMSWDEVGGWWLVLVGVGCCWLLTLVGCCWLTLVGWFGVRTNTFGHFNVVMILLLVQLNGGGVVRIKYGVTIRQRFNFRQFPFETQVLEINVQASPVFAGNGHTFTNGATHGEVILKDPTRYRYKSGHSLAPSCDYLPDW